MKLVLREFVHKIVSKVLSVVVTRDGFGIKGSVMNKFGETPYTVMMTY